jgi:two-component system KDP operon response regulator KdpE
MVMVVEDHRAQQDLLSAAYEARGHQVEVAGTGAKALELVDTSEPDLIVLDLGLPDVDGVVLCRHLRARTSCPIIVVTADSDELRVVEALDAGADDYVTKPFSMPVLLARSRVALRHRAVAAAVVDEQVLRAGDITLDLNAYQLQIDGDPVAIGTRQFELLAILVRNRDKVLTYAALDRALGAGRPGVVERNPWRVSVSKIRKVLGTGPRRPVISTELRVGYRLVVPGGSDSDDSPDTDASE